MEIPVHFAYLALVLVFGIIWGIFFILYPKTRKIQFLISFLSAPMGPVIEHFYFQDYWFPGSIWEITVGPFRLLVEDIGFAFFFTGVTGMLAHFTGKPVADFQLKLSAKKSVLLVIIGLISMLIAFPLCRLVTNSIFATAFGFLVIGELIAYKKKGSVKYALRCGILTALMMLVIYLTGFFFVSNSEDILKSIWFLYERPVLGARISKVPLTELIWGFSWGYMVGAVRNYLFG